MSRWSASRGLLALLMTLLVVAIAIAVWALVTGGGDSASSPNQPRPTPLPIPTSTPPPATTAPIAPTSTVVPTVAPTALAAGRSNCSDDRLPRLNTRYLVDTITTPLNQRQEPAIDAELVGSYEPFEQGLIFTGGCVLNQSDGYVWWEIDNGSALVWVASRFLSPS